MIQSEADFAAWYVHGFMPDHLPEVHQGLPAERLLEMTRAGWQHAHAHGFSEPDSVAHFVTLLWLVGPRLCQHAGFREALAVDGTDSDRIRALYAVERDSAANAIASADDSRWWVSP